jgi:hypothetical protein
MDSMRTASSGATQTALSETTWANIKTPGAYLEKETGHLYLVPSEALIGRGAPMVSRLSSSQSKFVKLSDDSNITASDARAIAAGADLKTNF